MFCSTKPSWQGGSLRAPVASPRPWLCQGSDPIQSQQNVSPFNHSRETSLSLHPSILSGGSGAIAPLETHSQGLETCLSTCTEPCTNVWPSDHQPAFAEAKLRLRAGRSGERSCSPDTPMRTSSRPLHGDDFIETKGRELSRCPSLEPSHRLGDALPQDPQPTLRGLDAAILPKMDHSQGCVATPEPSSSDLETCLSTDTEPCTVGRPIDPRHAVEARSSYPSLPALDRAIFRQSDHVNQKDTMPCPRL